MKGNDRYSTITVNMRSSMIMELIDKTKGIPGFVSFAGGSPSSDTFPVQTLAELAKQVILEDGKEILHYGASGGEDVLKEAIIAEEKINIELDEMQICSGGANGIYNAVRTFLDPGDVVICESPSFLGSLVTFEAAAAELLPVNMTAEGLDLDRLEKIVSGKGQGRVKMIYVIPDFQNPTGITMSRESRIRLLEIAVRNKIIILEDDPYSKLRLTGKAEESLFSIARSVFNEKKTVVAVRSFSKILGPGLRCGYVLADKQTIAYMNSWLQKELNTADRITQRIVAAFINNNLLPEQLEKIKETYTPLRNRIIAAIDKYMPAGVNRTEPEGGMFVWLTLPETVDTDKMFDKAIKRKAAYLPGSKFYARGYEKYNGMRLNFTFPTAEQIDIGIKRLAQVIAEQND